MVIEGFSQLKARPGGQAPKAAVVAAAHDLHTLQAVFQAQRDGLITPTLVGDPERIQALARQLDIPPDRYRLLPAQSDEACAALAVEAIHSGGEMLIKGMLPTGVLLKAVVDRQHGIRRSPVMSHVAILDVPRYHKLLFLTDGGMVIAPDLPQKRSILQNALDFCRFLGYDRPKAALLCAVETVSPNMPETQDAAALKDEWAKGGFGDCLVEGPISLDLATDREAARIKGYDSPVAGDADILLAPSIAAGNLLGKCMYGLAGGKMAGVVLGAQVPITINSRSAAPDEKYDSILLCSAMR